MKKVLVLTYYFPPCNLPGANRPYGWAKFFHKFGYYPVIVTRIWDHEINSSIDLFRKTSKEKIHEKTDEYEIYYLPHKQSVRDKLYVKYGNNKFVIVRKLLTYFELLFQNYITSLSSYFYLFEFSKKILKNDKNIELIVTTTNPYILFKYAYQLSHKFKIPWIADYRDDWNTSDRPLAIKERNSNFLNKILFHVESNKEKEWVKTASHVTSVSDYYTKKISAFVNIPGTTVYNGFFESDFENTTEVLFEAFTILYVGTLYNDQNIEIFIEGFKEFIKENKNANIKVAFIGLGYDIQQEIRIKSNLEGYESYYSITKWIPKQEVIKYLFKSHVYLLASTLDTKDNIASKVFEYIRMKRPIILSLGNKDAMEKIITDCGVGIVCNSANEIKKTIYNLYSNKIFLNINNVEIVKYNIINQVKTISRVFDNVLTSYTKPKQKPNTGLRSDLFKTLYALRIDKVLKVTSMNKVTILCFHSISDELNLAYPSLNVSDFKKIISYINENFEVVRLNDIDSLKESKPKVVLSFDDGYKNFIEKALPVLKEFNMPAIVSVIVDCVDTGMPFWTQRLNSLMNFVFVNYESFIFSHNSLTLDFQKHKHPPEWHNIKIFQGLIKIDKSKRDDFLNAFEKELPLFFSSENKMMNWSDLHYCLRNNIQIASHTLSHDSLITINDQGTLTREIYDSKKIIEKKLSANVETFTFPNGLYNKEIVTLTENAGYKFLLTTDEHFYKNKESITMQKARLVPRISINKNSYEENIFKIYNFHNVVKLKL